MVFNSFSSSRQAFIPGYLSLRDMKNLKEGEGHLWKDKPEQEVDDLNPTEDGEACE